MVLFSYFRKKYTAGVIVALFQFIAVSYNQNCYAVRYDLVQRPVRGGEFHRYYLTIDRGGEERVSRDFETKARGAREIESDGIGLDTDVLEAILNHSGRLVTFTIANGEFNFGTAEMDIIVGILEQNPGLNAFQFLYNIISREAINIIARVLENNEIPNLTVLNFRGSRIGDYGAVRMAEALRTNRTLTTLDIEDNGINFGGIEAIAGVLQTNTTLTVLNLENNNIDDRGAREIVKVLQTNKALTHVYLRRNNITPEGLRLIIAALQHNFTLTTFEVDCDAELQRTIGRILRRNQQLEQLRGNRAYFLWLIGVRGNIPNQLEELTTLEEQRIIEEIMEYRDTLPPPYDGPTAAAAAQPYDDAGAPAAAAVAQSYNDVGDPAAAAVAAQLNETHPIADADERSQEVVAPAAEENATLSPQQLGANIREGMKGALQKFGSIFRK